jgi:hypothetical protein
LNKESLVGFSIGAKIASLQLFLLSRRRQRSLGGG